jgi:polar amino acid transport system substrate-binding protein
MKVPVPRARIGLRLGAVFASLGLLAACASNGSSPSGTTSGASQAAAGVNQTIRAMFPKQILDQGVLQVGLAAPSPPVTMLVDGKVADGYDFDILSAVAKLAGIRAEFTPLAFSAIIPSLQAGRSDITGALVPSPDRTKVANFVVFDRVPWGLLLPAANPHGVTSSSNLCGLTVSAAQGGFTNYLVDARNKDTCTGSQKPIKMTEYATQDAAILAVKAGSADVFPQGNSVTAWVAKTTDNGTAFTNVVDLKGIDGQIYFAEGYGVLLQNEQLLKAVQAAIQELVSNGTYQQIFDKYGLGADAIKTITINQLDAADAQPPS